MLPPGQRAFEADDFFESFAFVAADVLLALAAALRAASRADHSLVVWSSTAASPASFWTDRIPPMATALEL